MNKINDGGPAFPTQEFNDDGSHYYSHFGLTKREYLATHMSVADIQFKNFDIAAEWAGIPAPQTSNFSEMTEFSFKIEAIIRVRQADALIAELEKNGPAPSDIATGGIG